MNYIDQLANDIYQEAHGTTEIDEIDRPLYRLYALIGLAMEGGPTEQAVHDAWSTWIVGRPDYDPSRAPRTFDQLSHEEQRKDRRFADAISDVMIRRDSAETARQFAHLESARHLDHPVRLAVQLDRVDWEYLAEVAAGAKIEPEVFVADMVKEWRQGDVEGPLTASW